MVETNSRPLADHELAKAKTKWRERGRAGEGLGQDVLVEEMVEDTLIHKGAGRVVVEHNNEEVVVCRG